MDTGGKNWAQEYLIDPISAPQPSEETGPGTSFRPQSDAISIISKSTVTSDRRTSNRLSKNNPSARKSIGSPTATEVQRSASLKSPAGYPTPPGSPHVPRSPHSPSYRQELSETGGTRPRRSSSLTAKYAGDMSHRPLDTLKKEKHTADRSRHSTRKHHIRPDSIDQLDDAASSYHHGGPYDATLWARNNSHNSPLQAVAGTNKEALKATPRDKIVDSLRGHRPLDGVASYAPGQMDPNGQLYQYEQGENMMTDLNPGGGAYKRWPGVQYHPDDIKGKGEPSYSLEKAFKDHSLEEKSGVDGIEMKSHSHKRSSSGAIRDENVDTVGRSGSFKGLKHRIGGLRKKSQSPKAE